MIKQIQLRGISRSPSDRMSQDGGLDESLNLYIDSAENAPALMPEDVTASLGLPDDLQADKVFVHKTASYEHIVVQTGSEVVAYVDGTRRILVALSEDEVMNDINAVGNIIIIATSESVYYVLWKATEYVLIGNQLPVPVIQVDVVGNDDETFYGKDRGNVFIPGIDGSIPGMMAIATFDKSAWESAARGVAESDDVNAAFQEMTSNFWEAVQQLKTKIGKWGHFSCPRFVRYAIKLYDGSYVYHSVPILIGAGSKEWLTARSGATLPDGSALRLTFDINLFYRATAKLIKWDVEGWEDIIAGVDIFISTDIAFPNINESFATCDDGGGKVYFKGYDESFEKTKEEVLSKVLFYKIESVAVRDLDSLRNGIDLHRHDFVEQAEDLVVRERLTSDYMTSHKVVPRTMNLYNNSLLVNAAKIEMPDPYPLLNGLFCNTKLEEVFDTYQTPSTYQIKFHIRRNNGEEYSVMAKNPGGGFDLVTPLISNNAPSNLETHWYARPMAWLSYPDVNCYEAEIFLGAGEIMRIPMSQHPGMNCAYAFVGLDVFIEGAFPVGEVDQYDYSERKAYEVTNQVMLSETNNPFIFPVGQRNTLQSRVLGVAIATTALSQGQFGQFPLYVFTEDGVWAMETAADGSFVTSKPLSRDVCTNPDSITSIDNAVIFVTAKGVMLLQGSQVVNISPYMNGRHYAINESSLGRIWRTEFADLIPVLEDSTPFMGFMKDASAAYDYQGKRLVFIKKDERYQYIYKLDTQTWHKVAYGIDLLAPINSYPECLVQGKGYIFTQLSLYVEDASHSYVEQTYELFYEEVKDLGLLTEAEWRDMFFNGTSYVVRINGKQKTELNAAIERALNLPVPVTLSYEEESIPSTRIYDLSTVLDGTREQETARGCIITRPMDFGYADVRKVINGIRIRGQYAKGAVSFMLLGSDDGETFHVLNSLRGRSWKLFRIIILADLDRHERISWIDIDFETRFTNRLR